VIVHIPLGQESFLLRRGKQTVGINPVPVLLIGTGSVGERRRSRTESLSGTLVERPVHHNHFGNSTRHGESCLLHRGTSTTTAMRNATEKRQLGNSQGTSNGDLGVILHREQGE